MAAELAIFMIWPLQASRTMPALIPSVRNGAFATCGVNYTALGTQTA